MFRTLFSDYRKSTIRAHDAGHDAFMAGVSFLRMLAYLQHQKSEPSYKIFDLARPFEDQIYTFGMFGVKQISLRKSDIVPSRKDMVYVEYPSSMDQEKVKSKLEPYN